VDPGRWRHIRDIFFEALELPSGERKTFIDATCAGDEELRREVEAMLASDGEDQHTIGAVVQGVVAGFAAESAEQEAAANIGRRIGPYQLIRQIGRGGMGAVYQAIRADDQYLRSVAIKLIAHGSNSPDDLARFRIERQILATIRLSHAVKDNPRMRRQLAGDLENIVSMALRKEPPRRYASVQQLSEDMQRHLDGLPVSAREDTLLYVAGKLVRRNKLASLAFALLILSVAAGWTATVQQAHRAEARFAQMRKLANSLLFDLHRGIQKTSRVHAGAGALVTTGLEYLNALSKDAAGDDSLQWELSQTYELVGDVQGDPSGANLGQYRPALASYRKAMILVEAIAKHRRDYEVLSCLTWLHLKSGDLEARTENQDTASKSYVRGLDIARVIDTGLHDPHARSLLSQVYQRMATSQMSLGNLSGALENARLAVDDAERNAAERPGAEAKAQVAQTRIIQGNILWLTGDLQGAWTAYDYAVKRLEETTLAGQSGTDYREQLQEAYRRAGDILGNPFFFHFGDARRAETYHRSALRLAEQLAERDSRNARAQAQLYDELRRLAAVMREGKPAESAALYARSLSGVEALWNQATEDLNYMRSLANTRLGYAHALSGMRNYKAALAQLELSLSLYRELISRDRERQVAEEDLFANLLAGGEVQLASGNLAAARQSLHEAFDIAHSFKQQGRARLYEQRCLALVEHRLGDLERALAKRSHSVDAANYRRQAGVHYENALAIWSQWTSHNLAVPYSTHQERAVLRAKLAFEGEPQ
jgi:tetratricopeptide (TPR) repeat protein